MEPTIRTFFQPTNPMVPPPRVIDDVRKKPVSTAPLTPKPVVKTPTKIAKKVSQTAVVAALAEEARPYMQPKTKPATRLRRFAAKLQLPAILVGGLFAGLLIQNAWFGTLATLVYGAIAILLRIPSRTTFGLAAVSLAAVCVMLLFKPDPQLIGNFSNYTFLLLIIGVIALSIEARPQERRKRRRGRG